MTPCTYPELFEALATSDIRGVLGQYFSANSCINSTRVLLEVFRRFGLAARPFAVRAMIFSRAFAERAEREGRIPQSDDGGACVVRPAGRLFGGHRLRCP
jgi:hypothetical protein